MNIRNLGIDENTRLLIKQLYEEWIMRNAYSKLRPKMVDYSLKLGNFTQKDSHKEEQKRIFHEFIRLNAPRIEDVNWEEAAKEIITNYYKLAGLPRPSEWLDLPLTDDEEDEDYEIDEVNNTAGALRTCLLNHFNETYNRYIRNLGNRVIDIDSYGSLTRVNTDLSLRQRIEFCINNDLTPHFKFNRNGKLIIFHSILDELQEHGIESDQISSLKQLAEILEMKYGSLRQNNKLVKCVHDNDLDKLSSFLAGDDFIE